MTRFDTYAEALRLREKALSASIEVAIGMKSIPAGQSALGWWWFDLIEGRFDRRCRFDRLEDDCDRLRGRFQKRFEKALDTVNRLR